MSRLLVNLRGCNGSGKSTIPISMMDDPEVYIIQKPYKGKSKKILTVFPNYGWVALGSYLNKTGGLDTFPDNELTKKTLFYALKNFPEYNILMEGVIASTVRSTYINLFEEVECKYPETKVIILSLLPSLDTCLKRVYERNGGKPIKEEAVENKYKIVRRNVEKFRETGFISIVWNNENTEKIVFRKNFSIYWRDTDEA